jgi:diguanylate cyclase
VGRLSKVGQSPSVRERLTERRAHKCRNAAQRAERNAAARGIPWHAAPQASARRISELERELTHALHHMHRDPLTGLMNRRGLAQAYAQFSSYQRATGDPMCCVYLDLDNFKQVNDEFGHAAGDACLQHLARILEATLRRDDVVARVGGDEFVILLPHVAGAEAAAMVYRAKQALARSPLRLVCSTVALCFCAGLTDVSAGEPFEQTLARADRCLLQTKEGPKNRTIFNPGERPAVADAADQIKG